ncbi:MAG: DNA-3-methyladenine glycosylase 2 family protein [Ruminococcaceae bacterium]|nr:DNA-3-methyladenine glycosylase 2 family protein [Oscillospiraceae bacterium]
MNNKYTVENKDNLVVIKNAKNFVLKDIFDCGQCFRFNKREDGSYYGVAHGKYIEIFQDQNEIIIKNSSLNEFKSIWKDFFDLEFDYTDCIKQFPSDNVLNTAASFANGIRILHQEHWETLCSFIISQNNNIPRIKKIIEALCSTYGDVIFTDENEKKYYSFPSPERILEAGEKNIFNLKTGFRAKYIIDAAKKVAEGEVSFEEIETASTDEAMKMLCKICGVGPKVASCVLLFSFRKYDCFPIDVWVKKILEKYYPDFKSKEYFGKYAGIAQQYLFYYERCQNGIYLK